MTVNYLTHPVAVSHVTEVEEEKKKKLGTFRISGFLGLESGWKASFGLGPFVEVQSKPRLRVSRTHAMPVQ